MAYHFDEFELEISENILQKGFNLFKNNKVTNLTMRNDIYSAIVEDKNNYEISFSAKSNVISKTKCQCDENETVCSHITAALCEARRDEFELLLDQQPKKKTSSKTSQKLDKKAANKKAKPEKDPNAKPKLPKSSNAVIDAIFDYGDKNQITDYFKKLLLVEKNIKEAFINEFMFIFKEKDYDYYYNKFYSYFKQFSKKDLTVTIPESKKIIKLYENDLEEADKLLKDGNMSAALDIYISLASVSLSIHFHQNYNNTIFEELLIRVLDIFESIKEYFNSDEERLLYICKMYFLIDKHSNRADVVLLITKYFVDLFESGDELDIFLNNPTITQYLSKRGYPEFLLLSFKLLKKFGRVAETVETAKDFLYNSSIADYLINYYEEQGDYSEMFKIAKAEFGKIASYINISKRDIELVKKTLFAAEKMSSKNLAIKCAVSLALCADISEARFYFDKAKTLVPEQEWDKTYDYFVQKFKVNQSVYPPYSVIRLFLFNNDMEKAVKKLLSVSDASIIYQYIDLLKNINLAPVIRKFKNFVNNSIESGFSWYYVNKAVFEAIEKYILKIAEYEGLANTMEWLKTARPRDNKQAEFYNEYLANIEQKIVENK